MDQVFRRPQQEVGGAKRGLEVFGPEIGDQVEERRMLFAGLSADVADKAGKQDQIEIMLVESPMRI